MSYQHNNGWNGQPQYPPRGYQHAPHGSQPNNGGGNPINGGNPQQNQPPQGQPQGQPNGGGGIQPPQQQPRAPMQNGGPQQQQPRDMSWVNTGQQAAARSQALNEQAEARRQEQQSRGFWPHRFFLKSNPGQTGQDHIGQVIILDWETGPRYHEHELKDPNSNSFKKIHEPCPGEWEACPLCASDNKAYFVMLLTVLNLKGYYSTKENRWVAPTKELLAVKLGDHPTYDRLAQNYGTLRGLKLTLIRDGQKSPRTGRLDPATPIVQHSDDDIVQYLQSQGAWQPMYSKKDGRMLEPEDHMSKPYDYASFLHKPDGERLRRIYGGSAPLGADYGGQGGYGGGAPNGGFGGGMPGPAQPPQGGGMPGPAGPPNGGGMPGPAGPQNGPGGIGGPGQPPNGPQGGGYGPQGGGHPQQPPQPPQGPQGGGQPQGQPPQSGPNGFPTSHGDEAGQYDDQTRAYSQEDINRAAQGGQPGNGQPGDGQGAPSNGAPDQQRTTAPSQEGAGAPAPSRRPPPQNNGGGQPQGGNQGGDLGWTSPGPQQGGGSRQQDIDDEIPF